MINTHVLFPKPKIELRPGVAHVFWEKIIQTAGMVYEKHSERLKQEVASVFTQRLKEYYPNGYSYPSDQMDFETWKSKILSKK
jgi:hypothetical protein